MSTKDCVSLPETALVTLWCRSREAMLDHGIIKDPMAIRLTGSIDYDFTKFSLAPRQDIALRGLAFDNVIADYLESHPRATVVALGEGLQTSFWRLDAEPAAHGNEFRWLTVDLPEIAHMRQKYLPGSPRVSTYAQSALDFSWMDRVDPQFGVFVSAEGLLPYLQRSDALNLIHECARRFPHGQMMFDLPAANEGITRLATAAYVAVLKARWLVTGKHRQRRPTWPQTPFSLRKADLAHLASKIPEIGGVRDVPLPQGRGMLFKFLWKIRRTRLYTPVRRIIGVKLTTIATLTLVDFAPHSSS